MLAKKKVQKATEYAVLVALDTASTTSSVIPGTDLMADVLPFEIAPRRSAKDDFGRPAFKAAVATSLGMVIALWFSRIAT